MLHGWLTEIEKLSSLPSKQNWTSKTKHCRTHCEARAVSPYYQSICFANQQNNNNIWSIWPTLRTVTTSDYFRYSENDAIFLNAGDFVFSKTWEPCPMSHWAFVKALQPQGSNPRSSWCSLPQWLWWPESASDAAIRRTNQYKSHQSSNFKTRLDLKYLVSYGTEVTELLLPVLPASFSRRSSKLGMSAGASSSSTSSKSSTSWSHITCVRTCVHAALQHCMFRFAQRLKGAEKASRTKTRKQRKQTGKMLETKRQLERHVICETSCQLRRRFNIFYLPSLWSCLETRFLRQN